MFFTLGPLPSCWCKLSSPFNKAHLCAKRNVVSLSIGCMCCIPGNIPTFYLPCLLCRSCKQSTLMQRKSSQRLESRLYASLLGIGKAYANGYKDAKPEVAEHCMKTSGWQTSCCRYHTLLMSWSVPHLSSLWHWLCVGCHQQLCCHFCHMFLWLIIYTIEGLIRRRFKSSVK